MHCHRRSDLSSKGVVVQTELNQDAEGGNSSATLRPWAMLIGINLLGSLLVMIAMHAPASMAVPPTCTAGWESRWTAVDSVLGNIRADRWLLGAVFGVTLAIYLSSIAILIRRKITTSGGWIVLGTLLIALPLLALPRLLSSDVYLYASYGRMMVEHRSNPFFHVPAEFAGDPLLRYTLWSNLKSVYGPLWLIVSVGLTWIAGLAGGSPAAYVMVFKLLALGSHLANAWIISRILQVIRPQAQTWGTILYAWNPFALMELVGSAHNDGFMITLVLIGCLMEVRGRRMFALVAFVCAGLVKLPGGLIAPAYVMYVAWQSAGKELRLGPALRSIAVQAGVGLATVIVLYAPFWRGPATLGHLSGGPNFHKLLNSPAARIYWTLEGRLCAGEPRPSLDTIDASTGTAPMGSCRQRLAGRVMNGSLGVFGLVYLGLVLWPMRTRQEFFERGVWIFVAYSVIAAFDFHPWYILWVMALASLMQPARPLLWAGCCAVFFLYLPLRWNQVVTVAFLPISLAILVEMAKGWRLKRAWRSDEPIAVASAATKVTCGIHARPAVE